MRRFFEARNNRVSRSGVLTNQPVRIAVNTGPAMNSKDCRYRLASAERGQATYAIRHRSPDRVIFTRRLRYIESPIPANSNIIAAVGVRIAAPGFQAWFLQFYRDISRFGKVEPGYAER
jgi:hypothetical protein